MLSRSFRILALAVALFLPRGEAAGQSKTLISLDQAIDLALAHNHALKASRTLILQNQAQEITANLRPNPTLGVDTQFIPFFSPQYFSSDNVDVTQQFDIGLSYLFERGKKRQHRLQAARDQTAVTRAQVADSERTLAFSIGQQFGRARLAGLSADRGHWRGAIQSRIHRGRRLSQDQAAAPAVSDRCVLCSPG